MRYVLTECNSLAQSTGALYVVLILFRPSHRGYLVFQKEPLNGDHTNHLCRRHQGAQDCTTLRSHGEFHRRVEDIANTYTLRKVSLEVMLLGDSAGHTSRHPTKLGKFGE
jgi:hypothetical protein